ncbi:MAG: MFS transporter [Deltaproteobacteria bacterium]|nr:MFS transporter [Deltaproteobacteria bacterium]
MSNKVNQSNSGEISTSRVLAYSSLTIPITAVGIPINVYLPPLYATELGLGLAAVGFIFMLARVWDVVTDPLVGLLIDRFPSRWGRRKHWIVIGTPILMFSAWFLYMPSPGSGSAAYLFFLLFMLFIGFTLIDVAHKSWAPDLAESYNDRSRLFGWRESVNIAGTIGVLSLPAVLSYLSDIDAYDKAASMGIFLIVTLPITVAIITWFVPDRVRAGKAPSFAFSEIIPALRNKAILRVFIAECFVAVGVGSTAAMFLFVAKWVFLLGNYDSIGLVVFFLSAMIAVPLWVKLSSLIGKHIAVITVCLYSALAILLFLIIDKSGSLVAFLGLTAAVGLGFAGPQILIRSMVADVVDQEELRSGHNRSGLYFALMSTTYKLGNALAVGISYLVLDQVGFDPAIQNSPEAVNGLLITFVFLPLLFSLLTAVCMLKYPLTKVRHEQIRKQLQMK